MDKVSFYRNGTVILHETEEIRQGADLLKDYFWYFTAHGEETDHERFRKEIASFYTVRLPRDWELREKEFEVEELRLQAQEVPEVFYDERSELPELSIFPPQKVIYVYVNDRRAGVYFTKSKVLMASDWTHSDRTINVFKQILPFLKKIFKKRSARKPQIKVSLKFGADPEFELTYRVKVVSASGVIDGGTGSYEEIGRDGAGSQVEIRPEPSGNIERFVRNFRKILVKFAREYPGYSLIAQGDVFPLGGHIHLSVPPNGDILKLLDNWIGKWTINLSGYARGSYKKMSAYETKPWGFEYRTPPAAIFLRPEVLSSVLRIIKAVIMAYFSREGVALEPCDEEIDRLNIRAEWQILQEFIANYLTIDKDVLKNWRVRRYRPKPRVDIFFYDDWSSDIRIFVRLKLAEKINKVANRLNKKGIYRLILFGFKEARGNVCNFKSQIFEYIDFVYTSDKRERAFGLPYSVRVGELTEELKEKWMRIIDEIVMNLLS